MKKLIFLALYIMITGVCLAEDITIRFDGSKAKVRQTIRDSVTVTVNGACVHIESLYEGRKLTLMLKGKSDNGQVILKTAGKAKLTLDGLELTSQEGAPLELKNKKKVEVAVKGNKNTLAITACNDTANHKAAVIWAKDKLLLSGKGTLNVVARGDGCRGIKSKKDITIEDVTLNVTTSGDNLGEKPFGFGFPGMPEGGFEMPEGGFPGFPDSLMQGGFLEFPGFGGGFPMGNDSTMRGGFPGFPGFGGGFPMGNDSSMRGGFPGFGGFPMGNDSTMRARFREFGGGFPMGNDSTMRGGFSGFGGFPMGNDSTMLGGFPDFGGGFPMGGFPDFGNRDENDSIEGGFGGFGGGFGGKHKYVASTKGIASKGKITINSGNVTVRTSTPGAEGIEGKEGIVFNGGTVDVLSPDDAINAGACIEFNGAHVIAHSTGNDAVDSNPKGGFFKPFGSNNQSDEPAIVIRGGTVYAWSEVGSPEEGLDCDFASLIVEGGKIFSVGGGMGEMPSVPTNETAKQPTALLIGINIVKDEPVMMIAANSSTQLLFPSVCDAAPVLSAARLSK